MSTKYKRENSEDDKIGTRSRSLLAPIPFDKLWDCDIAVIEDQLYTDRALTDEMYAEALRHIIAEKRKEAR